MVFGDGGSNGPHSGGTKSKMAASRHFGKFQMAISPQRVIRSTSRLILVWGFRGRRIEWTYFRWDQIQDGGWPPSWKISNGHISATDRPIDFAFDPRVGFSGTADQIQDGGWPPSWKISNGHISRLGRPIDFLFDPRWGFLPRRIEWTNFRLYQMQDSAACHLGKSRMTISQDSIYYETYGHVADDVTCRKW